MKKITGIILGITLTLSTLFIPTPSIAEDKVTPLDVSGGAGSPTCEGDGINTAIGCIHVLGSQETFLSQLLTWAIGVGGGIAFILIVYASFMIMSSSGNPERLKAGQELLTSAISGIILLVFSIFVLRFVGIDILGLNSFGFGTN